jgi:type VI secretion system protein ImpK
MTPDFAKHVDPVFEYVLELLDRLEAGPRQASGEREHHRIIRVLDQAEAALGSGNEDWMAAKKALVCWVDEMLSAPIWDDASYWIENPLEKELFNTADRALNFYTWCKKAAADRRRDALEVYYLCVILGFRGLYDIPEVVANLVDQYELPPTLDDWLAQTGSALQLRRGIPPVVPTGKVPRGAPELKGYSLWMAALLALITAGALAGFTAAWIFDFAGFD